jgi:hypothetical protein
MHDERYESGLRKVPVADTLNLNVCHAEKKNKSSNIYSDVYSWVKLVRIIGINNEKITEPTEPNSLTCFDFNITNGLDMRKVIWEPLNDMWYVEKNERNVDFISKFTFNICNNIINDIFKGRPVTINNDPDVSNDKDYYGEPTLIDAELYSLSASTVTATEATGCNDTSKVMFFKKEPREWERNDSRERSLFDWEKRLLEAAFVIGKEDADISC